MQTAWSLPAVGALRLKCKATGNGQGEGEGEGGMKCSKTLATMREIRGCVEGLHQERRLRAPLRRTAPRPAKPSTGPWSSTSPPLVASRARMC
jgi:hypothetical protein